MDHFEQIAARAYSLWESAGYPDGRDQEFWFAAENELRDEGAFETLPDYESEIVPPLASMPLH